MILYHIDQVNEDMVLGESLFSPNGELLLSSGNQIKDRYRQRLKDLGYNELLVHEEGTEDAVPSTTVSHESQRQMLGAVSSASREITGFFERTRLQGRQDITDIIRKNKTYIGKYIMTSGIAASIERFIEEIMKQNDVVLNLSVMQRASEEIFAHTMNVTITALCLGRKFRFTPEELKQLAIGAINYDIGLVTVPKEILVKDGSLTTDEQEVLNHHTVYGYYILRDSQTIPATSAAVALQHHENQNGSGYPKALKGDNRPPLKDFSRKNVIHRFAEIVAAADRYDMMTTGRQHYSGRFDIRTALRNLIAMGGSILNSEIVKMLVSMVPIYPVGARVRIVDAPSAQLVGYSGVIARDNPTELEKPQVVLYLTKNHQKITPPILVDLAKHSGFVLELI